MNFFSAYAKMPDHPGKLRFIRIIRRLFLRNCPLHQTLTSGHEVLIDLDDDVENHVFFSGSYEPETLRFIAQLLQPGDVVVCSGSAYGYHMLICCDAVYPGGRVVAVEPQPSCLQRTFQNLVHNGHRDQFLLVNAALSDKLDWLPLTAPNSRGRGHTSILYEPIKKQKDYLVASVTFDDLMGKLKIEKLKLFVLDVEGHEEKVLMGMNTVLPEIIVFEIHEFFVNQGIADPQRIFNILRIKGYHVHHLNGTPVDAYVPTAENNYVATLGKLTSNGSK